MIPTRGYAVKSAASSFEPFSFERRELKDHDVLIKILYCGICHSDIHQARNGWQNSIYPMVPGHEIVGQVVKVGPKVKKFKVNDTVGIGCFVDSCRTCSSCKEGDEQFCEKHITFTYNAYEADMKTPTYGGYSSQIVANEDYVLRIPPKLLPLANVAPLLCAGITTYSPLKHFKIGKGSEVGVIGLGGLGHMAIKLAAAFGATVTVFSTSANKKDDALRLGAKHFVISKDPKAFLPLTKTLDLIIDTVAAPHDLSPYIETLKRRGVLVLIGVPEKPFDLRPFSLISAQRIIAGSLIGGIRETQEMLDFCAKHNITSDIEMIPIQKIDEAYERTIKGDVRYRFVIDLNTL